MIETTGWARNNFGNLEKEIDGRVYEVLKTECGWECWAFNGVSNRLVWEPLGRRSKAQIMAHRHAEGQKL